MKFGLWIWRSGHVLINNERNKHLPGALTQCLPGDCVAIMLHNELVIEAKSTLLRCQQRLGVAQPSSGFRSSHGWERAVNQHSCPAALGILVRARGLCLLSVPLTGWKCSHSFQKPVPATGRRSLGKGDGSIP